VDRDHQQAPAEYPESETEEDSMKPFIPVLTNFLVAALVLALASKAACWTVGQIFHEPYSWPDVFVNQCCGALVALLGVYKQLRYPI
jgi:uncharacterized membrane protein